MEEEKLYDLLMSSPFESLSSKDKAYVLQYMTEEDYTLQRELMMESEDLFEKEGALIVPDLESKSAPLAVMTRKESEDLPWFLAIFIWRIPAYAMVIPLLLIGFLWFYNGFKQEEAQPKETTKVIKVPELITQIDTVFVEKEVPVEVVRESVKIVKVKVPQVSNSNNNIAYLPVELMDKSGNMDAPINLDSANSILSNQLKNISQSATDRPELDQFRVSVP